MTANLDSQWNLLTIYGEILRVKALIIHLRKVLMNNLI